MNKSSRSIDKADKRSLTQCFIKYDNSRSKSPTRYLDRQKISYFKQKDEWRSQNNSTVLTKNYNSSFQQSKTNNSSFARSKQQQFKQSIIDDKHQDDIDKEIYNSEKTISKSPQTNKSHNGKQLLQQLQEKQYCQVQEENKILLKQVESFKKQQICKEKNQYDQIDELNYQKEMVQAQYYQQKELYEQKQRDFIESQNQNKIIYQMQQDTKQENEDLQEINQHLLDQNRKLQDELRITNNQYYQQSNQYNNLVENDMNRYLGILRNQNKNINTEIVHQQLSKQSSQRQSSHRQSSHRSKNSFQNQIENISIHTSPIKSSLKKSNQKSQNKKNINFSHNGSIDQDDDLSYGLFNKDENTTQYNEIIRNEPRFFDNNDKTVQYSQEINNVSSVSLRQYLEQRKEEKYHEKRNVSNTKQSHNASMVSNISSNNRSNKSIMDKNDDQFEPKLYRQLKFESIKKKKLSQKEKQFAYLYKKSSQGKNASKQNSMKKLSQSNSIFNDISQYSSQKINKRYSSEHKSQKSNESSFSFQNKSYGDNKPINSKSLNNLHQQSIDIITPSQIKQNSCSKSIKSISTINSHK